MYLFDEHVSQYIVKLLLHFGSEVSHIEDAYGLGSLDPEYLPEIGRSDVVLVTNDHQMRSNVGMHGHLAILREQNVKALFLPKSFGKKPIGIPESNYPTVGWAQCVWMFRYWHEIEEQVSRMTTLSLARITDRGNIEPI